MFAPVVVVGLLVGSMSDAVLALGRDRTIAQFHHTAWTAKDGVPIANGITDHPVV